MMYIPFLILVALVIFFALPSPVKKSVAKVAGGIALGVLLMVLFFGPLYGALAEEFAEADVSIISVEPVMLNGETLLLVCFEYQGKILSWYDNGIVYSCLKYHVVIFDDIEVVNAYPVEEGGETCPMFTLITDKCPESHAQALTIC